MGNFQLDGGVRHEADGSYSAWCAFSKIKTELEATLMSKWLETVVNGAVDSTEFALVTDNIVDQLRDHLADVHKGTCQRHGTTCTCHYDQRNEELLREAAARIEVALEALGDNNTTSVQRALYALMAPRPEPYPKMPDV